MPTDEGDLRRLRLRHTRTTVELRLVVSGLTSARRTFVDLDVRTPTRDWTVSADWTSGPDVSIARAPDPADLEPDKCGYVREYYIGTGCGGTRARIRLASGLVTVSVPRRCLGTPRWVRVGASVSALRGEGATSDRWSPPGDGASVLGPRVRADRR